MFVRLIHGLSSSPGDAWFPWFKSELVARNIDVHRLHMPNPHAAIPEEWITFLGHRLTTPPEQTVLVAHSLGCLAVLRYAVALQAGTVFHGVILVGGWLLPPVWPSGEEWPARTSWLEAPPNLGAARCHFARRVAVLSDNDPYVPFASTALLYRQAFGAKVVKEHGAGHFTRRDGVSKVPSVLQTLTDWHQCASGQSAGA